MRPPLAHATSLALVLLAKACHVDASKWKFGAQAPATKKRVKVSFDDESFSFWDPFKNKGFNLTRAVGPIADEVGRRAPGYASYAAASTALGLFLPPKVMTAVNVAYVAAAVARSHEGGVETFCRDEGRLLLGMPSLHLAAAGTALRAARFRFWRRLFVRATLFRLRYQLRFMRIYRPRWVIRGGSPLGLIVQDTADAARSVQGLVPDLCHQAAFIAGGCRLAYWPDCNPPPRVEKGWFVLRRVDRRLRRELGPRARRVRPVGVGLLGWRIPHRVVLGTARFVFRSPAARRENRRISGRAPRVRGGGRVDHVDADDDDDEDDDDDDDDDDDFAVEQLVGAEAHEQGDGGGVVVEEVGEEYSTVLYGDAGALAAGSDREVVEDGTRGRGGRKEALMPEGIPAEGPLVRFHNVTTIASRGSTLTRSYRALAELPYGDGQVDPEGDSFSLWYAKLQRGVPAGGGWGSAGDGDRDEDEEVLARVESTPSAVAAAARKAATLQPVVIKRNVRRQLMLAEDDLAAARKVLRRLTFRAEIDLDMSGVLAAVAAAVSRAADLRTEARSIEKVRSNLFRAGMLGSVVGVPEVLSCPELGALARKGILVTTALRGVDVSDSYVMQHAAPGGEKERGRFLDGVFKAFGQMCLADGCFPSNPLPENLLYMYSGQVGLTDLSSVTQLAESQRRALCRLYHTLGDLRREDAANPSEAAELKARAAMESVGLVIDLPPAGGGMDPLQRRGASPSGRAAEEEASLALASAAERVIAATYGGAIVGDGDDSDDSSEEEEEEEEEDGDGQEGQWEVKAEADEGKEEEGGRTAGAAAGAAAATPPLAASSAPLTYVMLLRGLFDTRRDEALALVGGGGMELLKGMAVRRLPQAMVPVLKMVANLRGLCAHLDVDESILPRFSQAASKGLSWRKRLASSRGGGGDDGAPPRPQLSAAAAIYDEEQQAASAAAAAAAAAAV